MSKPKNGAFAWASSKSNDAVRETPEAWQATRAHPSKNTQASGDEWQATRILSPGDVPSEIMSPSTAREPVRPEAWQSTRAQTAIATQFLKDEEAYLSGEKNDIGRQTGANERELFVSCDPALAMQQQFEHLHPEFIAIHDIATASSRKLLLGIAAASGRQLQKLVIRRQGYGTPLATLEFVELTSIDNRVLRLYTTEADADTAARHGLARVLLAFSRLGAVMVGDLPGHAIEAALKPLREAIITGPWPNRNLLVLPLATGGALATHAAELGHGTGVMVKTTPQVSRPADAWSFITSTWNRLREDTDLGGADVPALGGFNPALGAAVANAKQRAARGLPSGDTQMFDPTPAPISIRPMFDAPLSKPAVARNLLERYVRQVSDLTGVLSCCVFDLESGHALAHAGGTPDGNLLGAQGVELIKAMLSASRRLGMGQAQPEAAMTLASHHLVLRPVPKNPGLVLHAVLDKASANLTLARLQILRMDSLFDEAAKT